MTSAEVKVRCIKCRKTRWVRAGEIPPGDIPLCDDCCLPMVAVEARRQREESPRHG